MNSIVVTSTKQNIKFGYEGEDNVTKIIFPYDESWLEYGEGNFEVRILRCGDEVAYTATEVVDDRQAMTLTMTVTDIELSVRGRGEMQLCYVCPDSIKKSPIYQYTVNRSVDYKYAVDPPEGSIIASVEKSLSEIKNTTNRLSNSVISIESSIDDVNSQIDNINDKISEFDEEIDSIGEVETRVDNLETSIQSINGRINTAEGNINENTESISDLNESVTELENRKVTDLETSGGRSDSGKYLTVGTDGKIKATSLTIPPTITVDASLSTTSTNPVQNKVIKTELNNINSNIEACNTEISKINGSLGTLEEKVPVVNTVAENYTEVKPDNWHNTATDTVGYKLKADGTTVENTNNFYTDYISVAPGDVVRAYYKSNHNKMYHTNITYYNFAKRVLPELGRDKKTNDDITVPEGAAYIRISLEKNYQPNIIITINLVPTDWSINYFDPYHVLTEDMLTQPTKNAIEALENTDLTPVTVKGYNLIPNAIADGTGAYYASSSNITFNESYTTYHYVILKVKPNTIYTANRGCRWWILASDSDVIITSGADDKRIFNTGDATKLYLTFSNATWNMDMTVVEGYHGCASGLMRPSFIGSFNILGLENRYACALPRNLRRETVGYPYTIYKDSALSISGLRLFIGGGQSDNDDNISRHVESSVSSSNGYSYTVYDGNLAIIDRLLPRTSTTKDKNLVDTTCLVIGDSTVAQNHMTQAMLDEFTAADKTLTLLGTRGTAPNLHEGRAGATAREYCTQATAAGITNPFYNSETGHFDFSQYMAVQGYTSPDFVIIQLGINDLYNVGMSNSDVVIEATAGYVCEMIESIHAYDANIRILINLPTTPNSDQTIHSNVRFVYNNIRVRYCEYMIWKIIGYISSGYKVRETYNHLILDASADISDNVHPTRNGYIKMGKQNVAQMNYWMNE